MTNLIKSAEGFALFFVGTFISIMLSYVIPPLMTSLESIFTSADLSGLTWMIEVLLYALLMVVIPAAVQINGLLEN